MMAAPNIGVTSPPSRRADPLELTALMKVRQAAYFSGLHTGTIYRLAREGKIRTFGRRGAYRVSLQDLLPEIERKGQA